MLGQQLVDPLRVLESAIQHEMQFRNRPRRQCLRHHAAQETCGTLQAMQRRVLFLRRAVRHDTHRCVTQGHGSHRPD